MGNSLRGTLGNLCGAEASKDPQLDEDQRPVAKPKEIKPPKEGKKKKSKKSKKDKKKNGGPLSQIAEGEEGEETPKPGEPLTTSIDNAVKKSDDAKADDDANKTEEHKPALNTTDLEETIDTTEQSNALTLKEQASISDFASASDDCLDGNSEDEDGEEDELKFDDDDVIKVYTDDLDGGDIMRGNSNAGSQRSECGSRASGLASTGSGDQNTPVYSTVVTLVPEELGISYADNIFSGCAEKYQIFVDKNHEFQVSVCTFQEGLVLPDKNVFELDEWFIAYKEKLEQESERNNEERKENEVDISDINVNIQSVRTEAQQLIATINNVRPHVQKYLSEAANVDVIEYVKGKMVEGEQLGITSKFSAPGKYRRNMKQLKKTAGILDNVQEEIQGILDSLDTHVFATNTDDDDTNSNDDTYSDDMRLSPTADNESAIVPVVKGGPEDDQEEDIFAKLHELDPPVEEDIRPITPPKVDGDKDTTYERKLLSQQSKNDTSSNKDKQLTLLEQSTEVERSSSASPETITYVIENIPEKTNSDTKVDPSSPKDFDTAQKSPVNQVIVEEEEHNTLDFGKYILVDPNTGDIQVMRNRSRSLDSLVSMTSNRSSLSRFGSFEFVTDFEINIAEKNQQIL